MHNYKIIDNFLNKDDFARLSSLDLKEIEKNEIKIFHNQIFKNGNVQGQCLDADFIKILFKNYHDAAMDLLNIFSPKKTKLWEYSEFHIVQTGSNYKYPIHRDSPLKLLSGVIYLKPKKSKGTLLYESKNGKNPKEITWKQNRGFFFARSENNSYHSYEGDGKSTRVALVYNLMTTKLKEVCEIENISYYKIRTREFINPYLYRFFKILF